MGPGARVGDQFQIIRKIGEGGCGEVYLAEQTTLGRNTVVKLMHPELSRDPAYVSRFQREARLAARLIHHHTAAIYAFGETAEKVLWIAMEYIDGESLHNVLARETPRQIAELLAPVADVLDRAGSMGIIHRDVKPDNILVAPDGGGRRAVLLDFGLARPMEDNDKLTAVGVAVGSPTYMSPEQVFGPTVDSATDRYALGIILYIAVTKRPPFRHDDRVQLVLMHKRNPVPPLHSMVPSIPLGHPLDQFFAKALAKNPTERFPSSKALVEEFVRAMDEAPLAIFGESAASEGRSSVRASNSKSSDPRAAVSPSGVLMPPGSGPPIVPRRPPPPPAIRNVPPPPPATGSAAPLRTNLPALGSDSPGMPEAPSKSPRIENINARSIDAWSPRPPKSANSSPEQRPSPAAQSYPEAPNSAPGHKRLLVCIANGSESLDILSTQQITIGKHRDCDVVCRAFPSPENDSITHGVSRQHARMLVVSGKLLIEDLRSLNGTFVDDRRLALGTQVTLSDGQVVRFGPVLTMEIRIFKGGAVLLRRIDEYHGGFPATLAIWREVSLGDPALELVPSSSDAVTRWGVIRCHGENNELWWYGPQTVQWQRNNRTLTGAQAILPGDRLTLGSTVLDWETGTKPGLT